MTSPKNHYLAWLTEYPDEGSLLIEAVNLQEARKIARVKLADRVKETPLTVIRATEQQVHRWNLDIHIS